MRILITVDPEIPVPPRTYGGIERVVDLLAAGLEGRGHVVALACHPQSTARVSFLQGWRGARSQRVLDTARNMLQLQGIVRRFAPDVLHSYSRLMYLTLLLRTDLPKIMSYQREPSARTVRWASRLAGASLTFSGCSDYICANGRRAGGHWETVHNPVDVRRFAFSPSVADDAPLLFLSRVERIKGAHTAIAVARRTGRRLVIAGNHATEGPEAQYWRTEILPHLGRDGVEYVGPVNDEEKIALLGRSLAMIVPIEWNEPFGIVFAEALACGTPVISVARGALPEIIRSGVDGYLVSGLDEACEAVERVRKIDRAECRRRAESCFSGEVILDRYERLYRTAAGR